MKSTRIALVLMVGLLAGCRGPTEDKADAGAEPVPQAAAAKRVSQTAEAGCAMCIFGMADAACELAVKIDGKVYLVEGSKLDEHGDPHAADGMCMKARTAFVEGRIEGDKFIADKFELRK